MPEEIDTPNATNGRMSLPVRSEFGFHRTKCACELCSFWCRVMPGFLVPSDLQRLCPPGEDLMDREAEERNQAGRLARLEDFANNGPYSQVWHMLMEQGLTGGGEHAEAMAELRKIRARRAK
jgi:hypothetical protein